MSEPARSRRPSILRRLTLVSWLVAVLSVGVFAVFTILQMRGIKERELEARSRALARQMEPLLARNLAEENFVPVVSRSMEVLRLEPGLEYVLVRKPHGRTVLHYREPGGQLRWTDDAAEAVTVLSALPGANEDLKVASDGVKEKIWHHWQPVVLGTSQVGELALGFSMHEYDEAVRAICRNTGSAGALVLVIGVVAAYSVARNLIRPLRELQSFAAKVTGGVLSARVSIDAAGEIGDLAESMNRMVESLEQSNVKLFDSMKSTASLREKEILLREIHHRVKNNMQILTSLLRLQARQVDSQELREVLQESEARIRSMGLLHEKLYQSETVSLINMHGYLRSLTGELARMHTPPGMRREIRVDVQGVDLGLDTALPCGLIITELVTNALKYAFHGRPEGVIQVSLESIGDGHHRLVVEDDGVGICPAFDLSGSTSLGLRLVKMLTDQLSGRLEVENGQGTRVTITFRESHYKTRL